MLFYQNLRFIVAKVGQFGEEAFWFIVNVNSNYELLSQQKSTELNKKLNTIYKTNWHVFKVRTTHHLTLKRTWLSDLHTQNLF